MAIISWFYDIGSSNFSNYLVLSCPIGFPIRECLRRSPRSCESWVLLVPLLGHRTQAPSLTADNYFNCQVLLTSKGNLSASGGNSGFSSETNDHCGDGGGGGVIQVFSTTDDVQYRAHLSAIRTTGGNGLSKGERGIVFLGGT
jgi:hypothetical protein